jgi:hypothetical protein
MTQQTSEEKSAALDELYDRIEKRKRVHLIGRFRPTRVRRESVGLDCDLGYFDSLRHAEAERYERSNAGWAHVEIRDSSSVELERQNSSDLWL